MKKNFLHWAMLLTAGLGLALASCSDNKEEEGPAGTPIFPKAEEAEILSGESYTLRFETNMKWKASIPASTVFYIEDGEHKVQTLSGEAGKGEVVIGSYEIENFDEEHSCEVTLTIGGESRVVATLTITQQERYLTLRTSQVEDGDFVYSTEEEGLSYAYNEEPAETIDLQWPEARSGYMHPIVVEANFAWRLAEKSEWIADEDYRGEAGQKVEILLKGDPTKYPLDGDQAGKFVLCARSNPELKYAYTVTIPACRDYFNISGFVAESRFNAQGQFYNASGSSWVDQGMHGYIVSADEPVIYKFVEVTEWGSSYLEADESQTSWINIKSELSDENNVLKTRRYDITVAENTTEKARKGVILALPKSVADKVSDPYELAGTEINEEYQKYIITTLNQAAETSGDFVEFYEDLGAEMAQYYTLTPLPKGTFPYEDKWAAVPAIYNLTYTTEMAGEMAELKFNVEYDSYEVYGEDGPYANAQLNPRWVDLKNGYNSNGKLIQIAGTYDNKSNSFVWTYEKPVNPEAYFVFKNGSEIVGIIQFRFEEKQQGGGSEISLAEEAAGVTLAQIAQGDPDYDADFDSNVLQYKLTFSNPNTRAAKLNLPEIDETTYYDDEVIVLMPSGNTYTVQHFLENAGDRTEILLKNQYMIIGQLIVVYQPE
ncbi:MAG: hypothetical protein K2I62_01920 [Alistipes sp.]|nr:hypothetical protein [Alistipes sp.]